MSTRDPFGDGADLLAQSPIQLDPPAGTRPDLNGKRIGIPGRPHIYLVDRGVRRWIPNPATFDGLFRDWSGISSDAANEAIPEGPQIADGAYLAKEAGQGAVYLVDGASKRWISSPAAMDRYNFRWEGIREVAPGSLDVLPTADQIDA